MYCLHNHLNLENLLFRIFRVVLLFSYQCSYNFQNLVFTRLSSCFADSFCLRQRDISYHARFNLSSTFFILFWTFLNLICQDIFKTFQNHSLPFQCFFATTNDILSPNCHFVNNFVETFFTIFHKTFLHRFHSNRFNDILFL